MKMTLKFYAKALNRIYITSNGKLETDIVKNNKNSDKTSSRKNYLRKSNKRCLGAQNNCDRFWSSLVLSYSPMLLQTVD